MAKPIKRGERCASAGSTRAARARAPSSTTTSSRRPSSASTRSRPMRFAAANATRRRQRSSSARSVIIGSRNARPASAARRTTSRLHASRGRLSAADRRGYNERRAARRTSTALIGCSARPPTFAPQLGEASARDRRARVHSCARYGHGGGRAAGRVEESTASHDDAARSQVDSHLIRRRSSTTIA